MQNHIIYMHRLHNIVNDFDLAIGRRGKRNPVVAFRLVGDPALFGGVLGVVFMKTPPAVSLGSV